jgi:hypothetical protein
MAPLARLFFWRKPGKHPLLADSRFLLTVLADLLELNARRSAFARPKLE